MLKVRAKENVYVNHRRYKIGEVFFIEDKQFSKRSMERFDGKDDAVKESPVKESDVENLDDDVI